jgi:hypothetical protein
VPSSVPCVRACALNPITYILNHAYQLTHAHTLAHSLSPFPKPPPHTVLYSKVVLRRDAKVPQLAHEGSRISFKKSREVHLHAPRIRLILLRAQACVRVRMRVRVHPGVCVCTCRPMSRNLGHHVVDPRARSRRAYQCA